MSPPTLSTKSIPAKADKVQGPFPRVLNFPQAGPAPHPNHLSYPHALSECSPVPPTLPESSPAHLSSPNFATASEPPGVFLPTPLSSRPLNRPPLTSPLSQALGSFSSSLSHTSNLSGAFFSSFSATPTSDTLGFLPSPPLRRLIPQLLSSSTFVTPFSWPRGRSSRIPGGKGRGLFTWRPQSSGAAAPSGQGGKRSPNGHSSQLEPNWEQTTIPVCLPLRLDPGHFQDFLFLPCPYFFLSTDYVPGAVLGAGHTAANKKQKSLAWRS